MDGVEPRRLTCPVQDLLELAEATLEAADLGDLFYVKGLCLHAPADPGAEGQGSLRFRFCLGQLPEHDRQSRPGEADEPDQMGLREPCCQITRLVQQLGSLVEVPELQRWPGLLVHGVETGQVVAHV